MVQSKIKMQKTLAPLQLRALSQEMSNSKVI